MTTLVQKVGSPEPVWILDESNPPDINIDNPENRMAFDDTIQEYCRAIDQVADVNDLPGISGEALSSIVMKGKLAAVDANTGIKVCKVSVEVDAKNAGEDTSSESFDTANTVEVIVNNSAGYIVDWSLTLSNIDSAEIGDRVVYALSRNNSTTGTNAVGDVIIEVHEIHYIYS